MGKLRRKLLTTTMIPAVVGLGSVMAFDASACMCQRKAAAKTYTMALENPEAVADPATGLAAGCGACGACGACGGCGACGAGCGACNPCAAECEEDPCNPCAVCEDPCGAGIGEPDDGTGVAWNVLTGEPSAAYVTGLMPQGDVPAMFEGVMEQVAGLVDEGIGAVGTGAADPGSRFVPDGTVSDRGNWRYTLSVS